MADRLDQIFYSASKQIIRTETPVYAISSTPPHLSFLYTHIHHSLLLYTLSQREREKHNVQRWGVRIALEASDIALYLMSYLYPTPHSPSSVLGVEHLRWMLYSLNPHTLIFSSHKLSLACIDPTAPVSLPSSSSFPSTTVTTTSQISPQPLSSHLRLQSSTSRLNVGVKRFDQSSLTLSHRRGNIHSVSRS